MSGELSTPSSPPEPAGRMRAHGYASAVCLLSTGLFLILFSRSPRPAGGPEGAVEQVTDPGPLHFLVYANALLITLTAAASLDGLFRYLRRGSPRLSFFWLALVYAYCAMNISVYGSQLALPSLIKRGGSLELARFVHNYNGSLSSKVNAGAYALVGIPSVVLGAPMLRRSAAERLAGISLISSAGADAVGFVGVVTGNEKAGIGVIVGAVFFLVAIASLTRVFLTVQGDEATKRS